MTDYPIIGETRTATHDLPTHGESTITVEVIDFYPEVVSWVYYPPYLDEDPLHPEKDEQMRPAWYRGQDITKATVTLETEDGEKHHRHASINRSVRPGMNPHDDIHKWESSCMIKESQGVSIGRGDLPTEARHRKSEYDMLWDWSTEETLTIGQLLDELAEEAYRLFEPRMQNRI